MVRVDFERAFKGESIYIIFPEKNKKLGVVDAFCNVPHQKYKKTRVKSSMTISLNYHVTIPAWDLENPAIFHDVSMNFHETFYLEIKTLFPAYFRNKFQDFTWN